MSRRLLGGVLLAVIACATPVGAVQSTALSWSAAATAAGAGASTSSWSLVPSPNTSSAQDNVLNGVSCRGPAFCVAVGYYGPPPISPVPHQTLIESWNGSVWSIVPSPNVAPTPTNPFNENMLSGVSCSSRVACIAVGRYFTGQIDQPLIESWNGSVWSIVPSPALAGDDQLNAVSCTGAAACTSVGFSSNQGGTTLIESWNGHVWSIVPGPNVASTSDNLSGVSCRSRVACVAVGSAFDIAAERGQTLIESWNGHVWSIVPSPNRSPSGGLTAVACTRAAACVAAGVDGTASGGQTLIESWNGHVWSIVPSPNPSATRDNELFGVACRNARTCVAVGRSDALTLIESWNGHVWSIVPSPNPSPSNGSLLLGVACTRRTCTAAGFDNPAGNDQTLIEKSVRVPPTPDETTTTKITADCTAAFLFSPPPPLPPLPGGLVTVPVTLTVPRRVPAGASFDARLTVDVPQSDVEVDRALLSGAPGITPTVGTLAGPPLDGDVRFTATGRLGTKVSWRLDEFDVAFVIHDTNGQGFVVAEGCSATVRTVLATTRIIGAGASLSG